MGKSFSSKFLWQSLSLQHLILISYSRQLEQLALTVSIELANNYYILKKILFDFKNYNIHSFNKEITRSKKDVSVGFFHTSPQSPC